MLKCIYIFFTVEPNKMAMCLKNLLGFKQFLLFLKQVSRHDIWQRNQSERKIQFPIEWNGPTKSEMLRTQCKQSIRVFFMEKCSIMFTVSVGSRLTIDMGNCPTQNSWIIFRWDGDPKQIKFVIISCEVVTLIVSHSFSLRPEKKYHVQLLSTYSFWLSFCPPTMTTLTTIAACCHSFRSCRIDNGEFGFAKRNSKHYLQWICKTVRCGATTQIEEVNEMKVRVNKFRDFILSFEYIRLPFMVLWHHIEGAKPFVLESFESWYYLVNRWPSKSENYSFDTQTNEMLNLYT